MEPGRCLILHQDGADREIDLRTPIDETDSEYEYFVNISKHLVQHGGLVGHTYLVAHNLSRPLPDVDESSIIFITGDEGARLPVAIAGACLILKCYGERPRYPDRLRWTLASLVDRARHTAEWLRWHLAARKLAGAARAELVAKVKPIPMGYCRQEPVEFVPFDERPYFASFSGSIDNQQASRLSRQAIADLPKRDARLRMLKALRRAEVELPSGSLYIRLTDSFAASLDAAGEGYAQTLMRTKICVCPRGTRLETFRIFEALRVGCVVISERLPDVWYLRGSPCLQVGAWDELPELLRQLSGDQRRLEDLHERSLAWWSNVCSPASVASSIVNWLSDRDARQNAMDLAARPDARLDRAKAAAV